ncbi:hypothetical protein [Sphingosinicella microcystinivorans]|uniref:Tetratricopeptide repeat protein n=1 Tax=Sphingosinicella microcystinivorans TaxID=335406 RepID=A0AAD1G1P0_SPHMI|nr:hypothetical protein [Sphingosinicella microcystinivorans]RKS91842.1 hypothetical protein DFR51_1413 [Sphingosinicella microcystinivorans]BBE34826.1 hypothetical protein SmB9_24840 [Sphingosinicella microcystinivorans]
MGRDDWYRNTTWNTEIEAKFDQKLRRAREKFQYLRIQALYLTETYPEVALRLLEQYFSLGENIDTAQAYLQRAQALSVLNDFDGAFASYEAALERERRRPNSTTQAYLDFPCLVLETKRVSLYARALEVLNTHSDRSVFPIDRFRLHGAQALLLHHFDRKDEARAEAELAMAAAQETKSGFRHHPNLGLVQSADDEFSIQVAALAV